MFDSRSGLFFELASRFYYCQSRDMVKMGVNVHLQYLDSVTLNYYFLRNHQLIPYTPQPPPLVEKSEVVKDGGNPSQPQVAAPVSNPLIATPVCPALPPPPKSARPAKPLFAIKLDPALALRVNGNPAPPAPAPATAPATAAPHTQPPSQVPVADRQSQAQSQSQSQTQTPATGRQADEAKKKMRKKEVRVVHVPTLREVRSLPGGDA